MTRFAFAGVASTILFSIATTSDVHAEGVLVALDPSQVAVEPGQEFDVRIRVTQTGPEFNAYHAVIAYDPQALTFIDRPASEQEGADMKNACGSTFHVFISSEGLLDVSHALLCPGLSLVGPDELYVLRFAANAETQQTQITFTEITFADAGVQVPIDRKYGALVRIGNPTDASRRRAKLDLRVAPNPFNSTTTIFVESGDTPVQEISVHDSAGRLVRNLRMNLPAGGRQRMTWDARDRLGEPLASGVYVIRVRSGDEFLMRRAVLLK